MLVFGQIENVIIIVSNAILFAFNVYKTTEMWLWINTTGAPGISDQECR